MPTYAFRCAECGYLKEEYRNISKRNDSLKCPDCGKKMDRLIGKGSVFILKGNGFYKQGWS